MLPPVPAAKRHRQHLRALHLATLDGWWIVVACCNGTTALPCGLLAQQHRNPTLGRLLARLACRTCGRRPRTATLTDRPDAGGSGGPVSFTRIELLDPT